ncbi:hypothetical protein EB75_03565 [Mycobacterium sp. ST-F2]|jgi:hypothetical protein|uniref:hypothetical protein n=1 Tax=unclassified Mycobacterium TaxID=2642494 RepID=UPI000939C710|nr:hypothetical protein [Mycobacterium sp. ST-F2]OKH84607.1 hypothetical protein EB75_03565 [Mycobacterium sp. ST-F2]
MAGRKKGEFAIGDSVHVEFGGRDLIGTVTEVSGYRVYVSVEIEGSNEPFTTVYPAEELVPA